MEIRKQEAVASTAPAFNGSRISLDIRLQVLIDDEVNCFIAVKDALTEKVEKEHIYPIAKSIYNNVTSKLR